MHDSEIANEESKVVSVLGRTGLKINGGGEGDAVSFRSGRGFRLSLFRRKFPERLGGGCKKNVVHGRCILLCVRTDAIDDAIRKADGQKTGVEVEWIAQMNTAGAT